MEQVVKKLARRMHQRTPFFTEISLSQPRNDFYKIVLENSGTAYIMTNTFQFYSYIIWPTTILFVSIHLQPYKQICSMCLCDL